MTINLPIITSTLRAAGAPDVILALPIPANAITDPLNGNYITDPLNGAYITEP